MFGGFSSHARVIAATYSSMTPCSSYRTPSGRSSAGSGISLPVSAPGFTATVPTRTIQTKKFRFMALILMLSRADAFDQTHVQSVNADAPPHVAVVKDHLLVPLGQVPQEHGPGRGIPGTDHGHVALDIRHLPQVAARFRRFQREQLGK